MRFKNAIFCKKNNLKIIFFAFYRPRRVFCRYFFYFWNIGKENFHMVLQSQLKNLTL